MSFTPENFTVWMEIPVSDLDRSIAFYNKVLSTELKKQETPPNPIAMFPTSDPDGVGGHLYPGKPPAKDSGPTIHFAIPDKLETALERVKEAGGEVVSDPISIPTGRFAYCLDLDGNSIGLFTH